MNLAIESSGTPTDELFNNLSNILSTVAWAGMALGVIIMVVSMGRLAFAYDSYAWSSALRGIIGGVGAIVGFGLAALLGAAGSASDAPAEPAESEPSPAPQPVPIPTPAPDPTPTDVGDSTPAGFDINPMILLAAFGAIGFVVVTWFAVSNLRARRAERREEREARERDWATGQAVYKGVLDDYSAYLLDPFAWLQRPILEDVDEPLTAAFLEALAHAQALDLDVVPADQNRIDQFRTAAHELRAAWDKADENARRIGTSIYERSSRNKLRKAAYALRTALDTSATAAERQAATETVKRLTDGLVKAPERVLSAVTAAIDTARRKELPVGLNQ
ncbi:hypothetical protein [Prescottella equi]|uniref:Putative integral membrane protein n=1 Tax=Rhodococcus hoagii TaxID=43767 RepID=B4F342_RHOHA|nr:hypothetical protein [Prescottella equi]ARX59567.1 putative integral membrane protein [Prescottella equi]ARX60526.1 putative integral membrane protein [Prescottella equi]ARX60631.1 putative integral membrane protein [Prescottella equi]QDP08253.1 hypothetical protein FNU77_00220 [Prescottella equi]CAQ30314.1 putative integral membrane protein [Prescottella equi]